jgi:hypothetical protein
MPTNITVGLLHFKLETAEIYSAIYGKKSSGAPGGIGGVSFNVA